MGNLMSKKCTHIMVGVLGIAVLILLLVDFPSLLGGQKEGFDPFGKKDEDEKDKDKDSGGGFFGNNKDKDEDSGGGLFGGGSSSKSTKNPHMRSIEAMQSTFEDAFSEKAMTDIMEASNSSATKGVLGMLREGLGAQLRIELAGMQQIQITPRITQLKNQLEIINIAIASGGSGMSAPSTSGMGFGGSSKKESDDEKSGWF